MKLTTVVLAAITAGAMGAPAAATAAPLGVAPMLQYSDADTSIQRAFRSVLNRDPTSSELRRYRVLMEDYNWSEADIRARPPRSPGLPAVLDQPQHAPGDHHPARLPGHPRP